MKWSRFNYLFHSDKLGYILFNSRTQSLTSLDANTYEFFRSIYDDPHLLDTINNECDPESVKKLMENRIIVDDREDDEYASLLKYKKLRQSFVKKDLSIVICPTLACNFACPYCYEHNLPTTHMHENVQQDLVDFIKSESEQYKGLVISWHGGEPLLAFNTIKSIYEKLETDIKLPIVGSALVTNGYLLTKEVCEFFSQKNLKYIQITIDGNKETHNKTRKLKSGQSSFEQIIKNVDMAAKIMPDCSIGIRTNIGRDNREEYASLYHELHKRWNGKNVSLYHSFVLDNSMDTCWEKRAEVELTANERNEFDATLAEAGIISKSRLYPRLDCTFHTCMDNSAYVVDPQGNIYKCWADVGKTERAVGSLKEGIKNYRIVSQYVTETDKFSDSKCLECKFMPICDGGCNLYRAGKIEKGIPYNACAIGDEGLIKILETCCSNKFDMND